MLLMIATINPPGQLVANSFQKPNTLELDQLDAKIIFPNSQLVLRSNGLKPGIQCTEKILCSPFDFKGNHRIIGYNDGPYVQIMGRYRE